MHMVTNKMYYGDYKFIVELDTGAETGANQRTVWVAEKVDIEAVSLSEFRVDQLLKALTEPLQSHLHKKLEEEKLECRRPFEEEIAELYGSFQVREGKKGKRLPGKVKRKVRNLREQMNIAIQRLEADFRQRELLSLEERYFDRAILQSESRVFKAEEHLRSFYFEEANDTHIHNFCRKFALDTSYRQEVLAGETHWVKRDELFVRNLLAMLGEGSLFANADDYDRKAHDLFHWFDTHVEEILALPEYQRLQEIDSPFQPNMDEIDPLIRPAVEALNRIPGVTTQFSCQGVSGKVRFQGRDLLVVSPHEEYAFVSFSELGQSAQDAIAALLPMFPSITNAHIPCNFALCSLLRSTGDNLRFREELVTLAQRVLNSVDENWSTLPRRDETLYRKEGVYALQFSRTSAPGGILPARLAWLCQPEQIERTLHLLFHLNHWAKARDHFLYADRQGLYKVKAVLLQQAYLAGLISPIAYVDGSETFASEFFSDFAAYMAKDYFIDRLTMLFENEEPHRDEDEIDAHARKLFARIMGYEAATPADIEALDEQQVERSIAEYLEALENQARSTRQPIPRSELAALFIDPLDLFQKSRGRLWLSWDNLDESEVRKLDPEGTSLIAFQYDSPTAHYVFHLPFRVAEEFLSEPHRRKLLESPGDSRECAVFYGRTITEAESQEHPIENILSELQVDVAAICPYRLIEKRERLLHLSPYWNSIEEDEDEDEEYWEDKWWDDLEWHELRKLRNRERKNKQTQCPLCKSDVAPVGLTRLDHWRQTHRDQDLTISHVAWVLGTSKAELQSSFTTPPDYRSPSPDGHGTRFWRLEALEAAQHMEPLHLTTKGV